ncbi:MAG: hypothetical protein AAGB19_08680 [Cyanobacteria bacterium P01_F01_bin.3]
MNIYAHNRYWSDQFLPEIKRIVGTHLIREAPNELDWHQATDLMMLDAKDVRVAARVRRSGYADRYPHEFTIRSSTASGAPTELHKIVNGHGDWMFYGHADSSGHGLSSWWILDLAAFRAGLIRHTHNGPQIRYGTKTNLDGTAFRWFDITSFPAEPPLVVARG